MILDTWAVDVAKRFPSAQVIWMNNSPLKGKDKPDNCEFVVGDIKESPVQFSDASFDFVHSRSVVVKLKVLIVDWSQESRTSNGPGTLGKSLVS